MTIKEDIKILLIKENLTIIDLAKKITEKTNKKASANSISKKLIRGTIKYEEVKEILDCLGYDINFQKKGLT